MKRRGPLLLILLWLGVMLLSPGIQPRKYTGGTSRDFQAKEQVNRSALGLILGEFRTSLSDMFYLQTENFLHYGVAFKPHDDEKHSTSDELVSELEMGIADDHDQDHDPVHVHDENCEHHAHGDEVLTVIPTAEKDYRSWLGNLHREIKPWQAPGAAHRLSSDAEVIPLFRMMTLADPHYVRGYQVGSYWIQRLDTAAARAFLEEGLEKNPEAFELYLMRGFLGLKQARRVGSGSALDGKDPEQRQLLLTAKADFQQASDLMFRERPSQQILDETEHPEWSDDRESDAMAAVHMAVMLENRVGQEDRAKELAERYLKQMPDHKQLRAFLGRE